MKQKSFFNASHFAWLLVGDLFVVFSFAWVGRASHGLSAADMLANLVTALPFLLAWIAVMPWAGIYTEAVAYDWKALVPRLLAGWGVAGVVAQLLRSLFLGRGLITGIIPTFAIVSIGYIGVLVLLWRLAYVWWRHRRMRDASGASS